MTIGHLLEERDLLFFNQLLRQFGVSDINTVQQWAEAAIAARAAADKEFNEHLVRCQLTPERWQDFCKEDCPRQAPLTLWAGRLGETWLEFGPETFTLDDRHAFTIWHPFAGIKRMLEQRLGRYVKIVLYLMEGEKHADS